VPHSPALPTILLVFAKHVAPALSKTYVDCSIVNQVVFSKRSKSPLGMQTFSLEIYESASMF
jgi:hypothetical protein